jgi:hypothetical protein
MKQKGESASTKFEYPVDADFFMNLKMNNFDERITDNGWAAMHKLLEDEMPVAEERRRRPIIWWFLLVFCSLCSGWAGWWYAGKYHQGLQQQVYAQSMRATNPGTQAQSTTSINSAAQAALLVKPAVADHTRIVLVQANRFTADVAATKQEGSAEMEYKSLQPAQNDLLQQPDQVLSLPMAAINSLETPVNTPVFAEVLPEAPKKVTRPEPIILRIIPQHTTRRLVFGPSIGIFTERFRTLNGASIGGVVDYRTSAKWGLTASLFYSYLRPAPSTRPVASLSALNYAKATGNLSLLDSYGRLVDPQTGLSTASSKVYVPLERLDRFEMPVMAYVQFFRRLRYFLGPTISYTQSVEVDKVFALNQVVFQASDRSNDKAVNSLAENEVKRWQLGLQTGLGMRLGDRFELDFFYRVNSIRTYSRVLYQYNGAFLEYAPKRTGQINNSSIFTLNGTLFF